MTITAEEALAIINSYIIDDNITQRLPFRVINDTGKSAVRQWLMTVTAVWQNELAWFDSAELAANNAALGESIIIEMRAENTLSGRPETLRIDDDCFDWGIN